jgi:DNA-binding response OmpR family regulator
MDLLGGHAHPPRRVVGSLDAGMSRIVLLSNRAPELALPAVVALGSDVKVDALDQAGADRVVDGGASLILVDGAADPDRAFALLASSRRIRRLAQVIAVVDAEALERAPWERVADDVLLRDAAAAEVRLRLSIATVRAGGAGDAVTRLGPLMIDTDSYQVSVAGRIVELTYKEFELLRFLVERAGRVFTRSALLHEVWGYDFYGGTRTVDVHVRRLRAKLGVEHEALIETVRGVGYRATDPEPFA